MPTLPSSILKLRSTVVTMVIITVACLVMLAAGTKVAVAQDPSDSQKTPYLDDWTHHHLVYSNAGSREDAVKHGRQEEWDRITHDPRYQLQQGKRSHGGRPVMAAPDEEWRRDRDRDRDHDRNNQSAGAIEKDWSTPLSTGPTAASASGSFSAAPTGGSLTITGGGNTLTLYESSRLAGYCGYDIFTGGYVGFFDPGTSASAAATNLAALINQGFCGSIVGVSAGSIGSQVTITATTTGTAGDSIALTTTSGFNFSPAWNGTDLTGGNPAVTVQPNALPAKWGASLTSTDCKSDFVVYPVGQPGSSTAANIVAYNNLYDGTGAGACAATGAQPPVYWAYNTGAGYTVTTSPIISQDGHEVVFVQSNGTSAQLVVLKWATGGSLAAPQSLTATGNISTCAAPCMTATAFSGGRDDTNSSPYYDYAGDDAVFVGDDHGDLQKFTGVLRGSSVTTQTPASLGGTTDMMASPVYDSTSGCVFVGDENGVLYSVNSGNGGTICSGAFAPYGHSTQLGVTGGGIYDAPLVDSTAHDVYVFVTDSSGSTGNCTAGRNCVSEFATNTITIGSTNANPTLSEALGTGAAGYNLYAGTFDNVYYSSTGSPSGSLYSVANTHTTGGASLYRVTIGSGSMTAVTAAVSGLNSTEYPWPSPLTEFCNNGTSACSVTGSTTSAGIDYIFFSVNRGTTSVTFPGGAKNTTCLNASGDGCIYSLNVSNPASITMSNNGALNVTDAASPGCWATSGIVIDNSATGTAGAEQIYFVNLNGATAGGANGANPASSSCATGGAATINAVQAAQSAP